MKKEIIKHKPILFILLLLVFCLFSSFLTQSNNIVIADEVESLNSAYSNVLEDLKKDENFNIDNYPVVENDYTIKIIQLAESNTKELFIYVYQPGVLPEINLTTISISTGINDNAKWVLYDLTLLNNEGALFKYKVEGLNVLDDAVRYYDIPELHRDFIEGKDTPLDNDNIIEEIGLKVGQLWTACTINEQVTYTCIETDVIIITEKYVDYIRYKNMSNMFLSQLDSHFVAFSTDKEIENLIEVDISYWQYLETESFLISGLIPVGVSKGKSYKKELTLTRDQEVDVSIGWLFPTQDKYNRIEKSTDFIHDNIEKGIDMTDDFKRNVLSNDWVLRFAETNYIHGRGQGNYSVNQRTAIEEVTILRLKFETAGEIYNLGVVDTKQNGSILPGGIKGLEKIWQILIYIGFAIVALIILSVLMPFMPAILTMVVKFIVLFFKGVWWVLTIPFKLLNKD